MHLALIKAGSLSMVSYRSEKEKLLESKWGKKKAGTWEIESSLTYLFWLVTTYLKPLAGS